MGTGPRVSTRSDVRYSSPLLFFRFRFRFVVLVPGHDDGQEDTRQEAEDTERREVVSFLVLFTIPLREEGKVACNGQRRVETGGAGLCK